MKLSYGLGEREVDILLGCMAGNCRTRLSIAAGWQTKMKHRPGRERSLISSPMSHLCNLAKSGRVARSIWLARTPRPWLLARTPRAMFTTSRRSLAEPNQHQEQGETPRFDPILPADESRPPFTAHAIVLSLCVGLLGYSL